MLSLSGIASRIVDYDTAENFLSCGLILRGKVDIALGLEFTGDIKQGFRTHLITVKSECTERRALTLNGILHRNWSACK